MKVKTRLPEKAVGGQRSLEKNALRGVVAGTRL